ncbi:tail fiber domain-containing protein [Planctobacterium marinum]|uniref:Peptidase S74 domain-containing protein n=1 Tax=Planctobacterium marinum TaxID=1631968 RepID=A0AA48KVK4_9ALTE|nr:hypothetical protein MACH26_31310 [Planctobacterium marinum]
MMKKTLPSCLTLSEITMKASSIKDKVISSGALCLALGILGFAPLSNADQLYTDDVIIQASLCVGLDCVNGESFNYDTIRLKENNVRIKFHDSSSTSSFPSNDWQITANDSANGGANKFSIEDISATKVPFTISAGAPDHSIFVKDNGYIGFNTSTPLTQLHVKDGNSPSLRIEQDGSSGFTSQSWDIAGNETNFFIRDVTNNSNIPFKIAPGASKNSLYIASDGDVGLETQSPDGQFDVAHATDANNHAFLINPSSYVGVNIDNGYDPLGWFDVQMGNGNSGFLVQTNGKIGIGTGTTAITGRLDVRGLDYSTSYLNIDDQGDIGIGTNAPVGRFEVTSIGGANPYLSVDASGNVGVGTNTPTAEFDITSSGANMLLRDSEVPGTKELRTLLKLQSHWGNQMHFVADGSSQNNEFYLGTSKSGNSFLLTQYTNSAEAHEYNFTNGQLVVVSGGTTTLSFDGTNMTINGAVVQTSSRTSKDNIVGVDEGDILNKLSNLAIKKWNYIADGEGIKHIGPIAEDFYGLFGLGVDEKHITTIDLSGVAIAGIQALNTESKEKDAQLQQELEGLKLENRMLSDKLLQIETKLQKLLEN